MLPPDVTAVRSQVRDLGLDLDDTQASQLLRLVGLLQHWNAAYNLTAVREPGAMWRQHVLDCLAAVPPVQRWLAAHVPHDRPARVLDVGSGGGLPGLVWAVALPGVDITCLDAVGKKVAFVRQAAGALALPRVQAVHARAERWSGGPFDLIASRAFASLADFTGCTAHLLAPGGCWVAMKGRQPDDELRALGDDRQVFHVEQLQVPELAAERCLVWMAPAPRPDRDPVSYTSPSAHGR